MTNTASHSDSGKISNDILLTGAKPCYLLGMLCHGRSQRLMVLHRLCMVSSGSSVVALSACVVGLSPGMVSSGGRVIALCTCVVTRRCGMVGNGSVVVTLSLYVVSIGTLHECGHLGVVQNGGLVVGFGTGVVCRILCLACLLLVYALLLGGHAVLFVGGPLVFSIGTEGFGQYAGLLSLHSCRLCTHTALLRRDAVLLSGVALGFFGDALLLGIDALLFSFVALGLGGYACCLVLLAQLLCGFTQGFILCDGLIEGCNAVALGLDAAHVDDTEPPRRIGDGVTHVAALQ